MTKVVVVIDENGQFSAAYADTEISCLILRKGKDDRAIDKAETELEEITE
jgi:hypothetical protein